MYDRVRALLFPKVAQDDIGYIGEHDWHWFGYVDGDEIELVGFRPIAVTIMPQGVYVWFRETGIQAEPVKLFWPMGSAERKELRSKIKEMGFPIIGADLYLSDSSIRIR